MRGESSILGTIRGRLRSEFQEVRTKSPRLASIARRVYRRQFVNTVRRKVAGRGNSIDYSVAVLNGVTFTIRGNDNTIVIAPSCILNDVEFFVRGNNNEIVLGEECRFSRGGSIWVEDDGCVVSVGRFTTVESVHLAATESGSRIDIGEDCMFAYDIDVRTGDSHSVIDARDGARLNPAENVTIGDHVWVGAHCSILKGVEIEENSIVATGALVTKGFDEAGVVLAGNPAKIVKRGITWSRERDVGGDPHEAAE